MPCDRPKIRYESLARLRSERLDRDDAWLGPAELAEQQRWRSVSRRLAWRYARLVSKQLIADWIGPPALELSDVEITSRDAAGQGVRPEVRVGGAACGCCLSISHTDRGVLAALWPGREKLVGVDLTPAQNLPEGFLSIWFTEAEQDWLETADPAQSAVCWAVKEAIYKACNTGERFAPRRIEVFPNPPGRYTCRYNGADLGEDVDIRTWAVDGQTAALAILRRKSRQARRMSAPSRSGRSTSRVAT